MGVQRGQHRQFKSSLGPGYGRGSERGTDSVLREPPRVAAGARRDASKAVPVPINPATGESKSSGAGGRRTREFGLINGEDVAMGLLIFDRVWLGPGCAVGSLRFSEGGIAFLRTVRARLGQACSATRALRCRRWADGAGVACGFAADIAHPPTYHP